MAHHRQVCTPNDKPDPELLAHIAALGLNGPDDYTQWCARHGFSRRLTKHWRQRLKERSFHTEAVCRARLSQKKRELRKPDKILEAIYAGDLKADAVTEPYLKQICRAFEAVKLCERTKQALLDLLLHVGSRSKLLVPRFVIPEFGRMPGNTFVGGLLALARFSHEWLRPLDCWKPQTHNVRRQFSSLARHLLAEWPVPTFMDSAWFRVTEQMRSTIRNGFCTLAQARTSEPPIFRSPSRSGWRITSFTLPLTSRSTPH